MDINHFNRPDSSSYQDYFHYSFDALTLLNLRLLKELRIRQKMVGNRDSRGLFISEEEVVSTLNSFYEVEGSHDDVQEIESIDNLIDEVRRNITRKVSNTKNIERFPMPVLARIFGLMPFELDILIMALAPEIDARYDRIYAYFNDDLTKKAPSVCLALDILFNQAKDKLNSLQIFSSQAPLLHFQLIHWVDDHEVHSFLNRRFILDERIRRFILGDNGPDEDLSGIVEIYYPDGAIPNVNSRMDVQEQVNRLIMRAPDKEAGKPVLWLYGAAQEEKKAAARAICNEIELPLFSVDLADIFYQPERPSVIRSLFREAALQTALVFLKGGDLLLSEDEKSHFLKRTLFKTLNEMSWITFISAEGLWMPEESAGKYQWFPFEFKRPGYAEDGIDKIGNLPFNQKPSIYSTRVTPHYTWADIVLPEDKERQLREICNYVKHKHLVYDIWGFAKKLALGKGLNILFSGPSGTGKTMAADIIAAELKLDLYKIDLSSVVSKYIGETEKNLNRIFGEVASSRVILFFDEADALFGKRSEVKDAHDRYANIETNYLLQKMEEHESIVILATNFSKNLDDAFLRRMHLAVEFPFPDEKQREQIWRKIFPESAPLSKDLDYRFLAEKFMLTGGNIKNIALTAAIYAAEDSGDIEMRHIIMAVKREFQKMGKLCLKADFGEYYELLLQ